MSDPLRIPLGRRFPFSGAITCSSSYALSVALLFAVSIALNAGLLFLIQPLIAKIILPVLGGSAAVWNTSLLFYQFCLMAGYGYAHFGNLWLGRRAHALIHLNLMLLALALLPISVPGAWLADPIARPIRTTLTVLTYTIGFPFLVLSAGTPLLQRWFAHSQNGRKFDPYFLYGASNLGSIGGLLAYPLLLEPRVDLNEQNHLWCSGFVLLVCLFTVCVFHFLRQCHPDDVATLDDPVEQTLGSPVGPAQRLRWIFLSFVPSSLLLGVTSYITTDIASIPLLWVLPLCLYLLSFILTFVGKSWPTNSITTRLQALFLAGAGITVFMYVTSPSWVILPLHLCAFLLNAIVCHGRLYNERPEAVNLTDFYFCISFGGVLGGAFNALIAPQLFNTVLEYPVALALVAFLRPNFAKNAISAVNRILDWILPPLMVGGLVLITIALTQNQLLPPSNDRFLIFAAAGAVCLVLTQHSLRFGLGLTCMLLVFLWLPSPFGKTILTERSFFGAYRVILDAEQRMHVLFHGTTAHGAQSLKPERRREPTAYYHRTGPAGQVLSGWASTHPDGSIAIVGLGTGALACYGTAFQKFTFYEIDPAVEKIARNEELFTYLRDCSPQIEVVIGDARISLASAPANAYDIAVLDAFSSDAVPTHLLTREALELYLAKTAADGMLLFHISNRYFDLAPPLNRLAKDLKLAAYIRNDFAISALDNENGKVPSRWIALARENTSATRFLAASQWQPLETPTNGSVWTDKFSNLVELISWP